MQLLLLSFIIIIFTLRLPSRANQLPDKCTVACLNRYISCVACLELYNREIGTKNDTYPCLTGYVQKMPPAEFCCPQYCETCVETGCATCKANWQIDTNNQTGRRRCVCRTNYEFDQKLQNCICKSVNEPTLYYSNPQDQTCRKCPVNCTCTRKGCESCLGSTNREINYYAGIAVCECLKYFDEDEKGGCSLKKGCSLIGAEQVCSLNMGLLREVFTGAWYCEPPLILQYGECVCKPPYVGYILGVNKYCVCASKNDVASYYEFQDICYKCPQACTCNDKGCISCSPESNMQVSNYNCSCKSPFTQLDEACLCLEPYYTNSNGECVCISQYYQSNGIIQYALGTGQCQLCPAGCTCTSLGCVYCGPQTLRKVEQQLVLLSIKYVCQCGFNSYEKDKECVCKPGYVLQDNLCVCLNKTGVYDNPSTNSCMVCPQGCNCENLGCSDCPATLPRINQVSSGVQTCNCLPGFQQKANGGCACPSNMIVQIPAEWPLKPPTCVCGANYIEVNGFCICKALNNNTGYYFDRLRNYKCSVCPDGCICNKLGCVACSSSSLRVVFRLQGYYDEYYACECVQTALKINDECRICQPSTFYYRGQCLSCSQCLTCSRNGCKSCWPDQILDPLTERCICNHPKKRNLNGHCVCPPFQYLTTDSDGNETCEPCPPYCKTCMINNSTGFVKCQSCDLQNHRQNSPETNCPCQPGFFQTITDLAICCNLTCQTCNRTHCLSCLPDTNRALDSSGRCSCINNLIEVDSQLNCTCAQGMFLYYDTCEICPIRCKTCVFIPSVGRVMCTSCHSNSNRMNGSFDDCQCLRGFEEADPVLIFCYPSNCLTTTPLCDKCSNNMVPSQDRMVCICKDGTYFNSEIQSCVECKLEGCLKCLYENYCVKCDTKKGYYLTEISCNRAVDANLVTFSQDQGGLLISLKFNLKNKIQSIVIEVAHVYNETNETTPLVQNLKTTILQYHYSSVNQILSIKATHPANQVIDALLLVQITEVGKNITSTDYVKTTSSNSNSQVTVHSIKVDRVYSQYSYISSSSPYAFVIGSLSIVFGSVLTVIGWKPNQLMFFIQTMAFLGYVIPDPDLNITPALFNLRIVCYDYRSMFQGLVSAYYIEQSYFGNFRLFTLDSNLFRVAAPTLVISFISGTIHICGRIIRYYMFRIKKLRKRISNRTVKLCYRLLEFAYKTCMYPLLYFSLNTFFAKNVKILSGDTVFRNFTLGFSLLIILIHAGYTIYQIFYQNITRLTKSQSLFQFLFGMAASLTLILTTGTQLYGLILIILILKKVVSFVLRKMIVRDFQTKNRLIVIPAILECTSIGLCYYKLWYAVYPIVMVSVMSELFYGYEVIREYERYGTVRKAPADSSEVTENKLNMFVDGCLVENNAQVQPSKAQAQEPVIYY